MAIIKFRFCFLYLKLNLDCCNKLKKRNWFDSITSNLHNERFIITWAKWFWIITQDRNRYYCIPFHRTDFINVFYTTKAKRTSVLNGTNCINSEQLFQKQDIFSFKIKIYCGVLIFKSNKHSYETPTLSLLAVITMLAAEPSCM